MFSNKKVREKDFYFQQIKPSNIGDIFTLNEENTHHIAVVLRRKINDNLIVIDGNGYAYFCSIVSIDKRHCEVKIEEIEFMKKRPYSLFIGIGLTKNKARNEWFYEKSVEIGIDGIMVLDTMHSEAEITNFSRVLNILTAAMIQSKSFYLPEFHEESTIENAIKQFKNNFPDGQILIAHCEENEKNHILKELKIEKDTLILIGPEGDFSLEEIDVCIKNGAKPVSLGGKRLRTETAAIYATTIFNALNYE